MSETKFIDSWSDIGVNTYGRDKIKVLCPNCHEKRSDKRDKSLSIDVKGGVSHCHYCEISYVIKGKENISYTMKEYKKPVINSFSDFSDKIQAYFEKRGIPAHVLRKLGITEGHGDLNGNNTIHFNYFENGNIVNVKWRTGDKKFKLGVDCESIPYNIDSVKDEKYVIVCEGEIDCMSFIACNKTSVISVPNGANENTSYLDRFIESHFEDKEIIYIASDTDSKGVILRNALITRFGAERCKIVTYGNDCKDANEVLTKYGSSRLLECLDNAEYVPVDGVIELNDFEDELDALYDKGLMQGAKIGIPAFDRLCTFDTKRLCVVTGIPSSGKTEFLEEMTIRLNLNYGWKCAYFSPESLPESFHASRIISRIVGKRFGKDSMPINEYKQAKIYVNNNFFFNNPENWDIDTILEKFKFIVRRKGVKMVVIDPYNNISIKSNGNVAGDVNETLEKMQKFAQKNDVLFFLMAHPKNMNKDAETGKFPPPTMYDISGGANFYNKADFGLTIHRNKEENTVSVIINKIKFSHLGRNGECKFHFNINNARYVSCPLDVSKEGEIIYDNSNWLVHKLEKQEEKADLKMFNEVESREINTDNKSYVDNPYYNNIEKNPFKNDLPFGAPTDEVPF